MLGTLPHALQKFFGFDGMELVFSDEALVGVADKALERETGARGLRSIIEEILLEVQFELPSRRDVKKVVVTKEKVELKEKLYFDTVVFTGMVTSFSTPCMFSVPLTE